MADLLQIGLSGLSAYKTALTVASGNIANASTRGYARRDIQYAEKPFGNGVNISDINRVVNDQVNTYAFTSSSQFSKIDAYLQKFQQLESFLGNDDSSLGKIFNDAKASLQSLDLSPNSYENRNVYLARLQEVVDKFHTYGNQIISQRQSLNQSQETITAQVNSILKNLANINSTISGNDGSSLSDPNSLLDQRELLLEQLSQYIGFSTQSSDQGQVNVLLPSGTTLVIGNQASQLSMIPDPASPQNFLIGLNLGLGFQDVTKYISEGELAGLQNFKTDLDSLEQGFNQLALAFTQQLNAQNNLGLDALGNFGDNIFNDINSTEAMNSRVIANQNNSALGNLSVKIDSLDSLKKSDYKIIFGSSNQYSLTRLSDNAVVASGVLGSSFPTQIQADGFTLAINTGTYASHDQYLIKPAQDAMSKMTLAINDPNRLALAWPIYTSNNQSNLGMGKITMTAMTDANNASFATPSTLTPPIRVEFTSTTNYNLINSDDNSIIESNLTYNPSTGTAIFPTSSGYDPGYRVFLTGEIKTGDSFNIAFNHKFSGDNRNGLALEQIFSQGILQNSTLNFNQAFDALHSDIAIKTNMATQHHKQVELIKEDAEQKRDQISGVSIEEETINLTQYQQAYQASAQILQTAKYVLDTVMQLSKA